MSVPAGPASPGPVQRAAYRVWLAVGVFVLMWIGWRILARPLAVVVPPLLLTTVIVYLQAPIVAALERRGLPRWAGTLLAYLVGLLSLVILATLLVPLLTEQLRSFAERLPDLLVALGESLDRQLRPLGIDVPIGESIDGAALQANIEQALQGGALPAIGGVLGGLSGLAVGFLQVVLVFTLGPVVAFYVLVDLPRLRRWSRALVPPRHRVEVSEVATKLHVVVGGFIRGQLLVALFVGVTASIGLAAVGLPFWLLVGVTAGLTNVIPLLGPFVAGVLGISIALVSDGVGLAVLVLIVLIVVQQLDNQVISPLVMGRNVHVHPLVVLLSLVVAGTVYGVLGLLVAVPAVAAVSVLARHVWETRVPWSHEAASSVPPIADSEATPATTAAERHGETAAEHEVETTAAAQRDVDSAAGHDVETTSRRVPRQVARGR